MILPRRSVALVSDSEAFGGAEAYLAVLATALSEQCTFTAWISDRAADETEDSLIQTGVTVHRIKGLRRFPSPSAAWRLARALAHSKPALIHINATDQRDGVTALAAARLVRRSTLATVHLGLPGGARWREHAARVALATPHARIAVSEAVADRLRNLGLTADVVHNGLPVPVPDPAARARLGLDEKAFVVGAIARLADHKGLDLLCRAASDVRERVPRAEIVIVGEGPDRHALERLAAGQIRFVGGWKRAASLLSAFDVLVAPSRFEGLPLVPIEAMLSGVPVVGTRVGGVEEVVGESGVLVDPESPSALAEALVALAYDPARRKRLAAAGRHRAETRFGVDRMADETFAVYDRLLARTPD